MTIEIDKTYLGCFGKGTRKINPTAIVIHHSCTKSPKRTRQALQSKNCSTHFEIDTDGHIYQYREENLMCSHCGSSNCHTIGIDLTHMDGELFPAVQINALRELLIHLCIKWHIRYEVHPQLEGIYLHRALGDTVCPGNNFPVNLIC